MPTPFYHLSLADEMLSYPGMPETLVDFLKAWRCEFMFGVTAPDVQVVSGLARERTHFFNLPIEAGDRTAWEVFLAEHPALSAPGGLPPAQSAFLAGYLCHLQADWLWVKDIFTPVFGPHSSWGDFHQRLYYHNVLRAYLDLHILADLPPGMDICLGRVNPEGWLPFVSDKHLIEWRDFLSAQLSLGARVQTVDVFSSRQGISTTEYYELLGSEERMQQEVFEHLSLEMVEAYKRRVLEGNNQLLSDYLAFRLHPVHVAALGDRL